MGSTIRNLDWTSRPLGSPEHWPAALKGVVDMMLESPFAMCMAWGDDLTFLYNDAYIPVLGARHDLGVIGQPMKDVWWDVWDSISPWIDKTLAGEAVRLEDTHLVMQRNGFPEDTYWSFAYSPISDGDGTVRGFIDICIETTGKVQNEREAADAHGRFRQLFDTAPAFMALTIGPNHVFELTNSTYVQLVGHRELVGKPVKDALGKSADGFIEILDGVYETGVPYIGSGHKFAVQRSPSEPANDRYLDFVYYPLRDGTGKVYGIFVNGIDVTERRRSDLQREVLQRELIHRVKNTMAVASAVVTSSMRHATSLEEARDTITARIAALARSQSLLTRPEGDVDVDAVVREALTPHLDNSHRLSIDGPTVMVSAQQAVGLSLALYELATNAQKYGALSVPEGLVAVSWSDGPGNAFEFHWSESGGPTVSVPTRSGFGSRLTNRIVASYFSGVGETTYAPDGVQFSLKGTTRVEADEQVEVVSDEH